MERILDTRPNRPLTSREIATVICGTLGGFASFCDPKEIEAAIRFVYTHRERFLKFGEAFNTTELTKETPIVD